MTLSAPLWAEVSDLPDSTQGDEKAQDALEFASFVLWSLSGRMYAPETVTREAYDTRQTLAYGAQVYPVFLDGMPVQHLVLQRLPVQHVRGVPPHPAARLPGPSHHRVWVNGVELHPSEWVLLDNAVLGLRSANSCNAQCITVEYSYGSGVPAGGKIAAVKLAEQLLLSTRAPRASCPPASPQSPARA